jgi:triosephosphate isomerase
MKPLIVANWKMNPSSLKGAKLLLNSVKRGIKKARNVEAVVCPSFPFISGLKSEISNLKLGAQDCFWEDKGAFTGEVSPKMLKDLGCQHVILGHSERRRYLNETDEMVNKKIKAALKNNLKPVLCVENVLQVKKGLKGISKKDFKNIVVAFEPVFAIGTGKPCHPQKAERMRKAIKNAVNADIPIIYGGSVNSENARDYIEKAEFQGFLIGGASLKSGEFIKIIKKIAT